MTNGSLGVGAAPVATWTASPTAAGYPEQAQVGLRAGPRRAGVAARPRREASLELRRIDPWAWLKVSLIVSVVMFFVWMLTVGVLYVCFGALGVWSHVNATFESLASSGTGVASGKGPLVTGSGMLTVTAILGAVVIVLFTVLSTAAVMLYNAAAGFTRGVEVSLAERPPT
jgi:hypothetical protein